MAKVEGTVEPRFAALRDVMEKNLASGLELGAAVSVVIDGKMVADLWGGHRDLAKTKAWEKDTLVNV